MIFKVITILLTFLSSSTNAQPLTNFVDLNQSREFFENGREQFELEINRFQQPPELPEIRLLEDYEGAKQVERLIKNEKIEVKSISDLASDRYHYIYGVISLN